MLHGGNADIRFFGLIVGDLIKNLDDKVWKLFTRVDPSYEDELNSLVKKHNELFIGLFNNPLKPKFHYLVHYSRFLLINGPLSLYWVIRFESRHRQLKAVATSISCNINLIVSIATKQTLKMCSMMHFWLILTTTV